MTQITSTSAPPHQEGGALSLQLKSSSISKQPRLRQDFALNLLAKRRLCNTVGAGIGRSVEDCVVSDARSRAAATTNLARSSQALVLSTLFMICPQWSAWWPADEQIVPPIPRLSYGMIKTPHLIQRLPNNRDL
jgi:hypothetical protein